MGSSIGWGGASELMIAITRVGLRSGADPAKEKDSGWLGGLHREAIAVVSPTLAARCCVRFGLARNLAHCEDAWLMSALALCKLWARTHGVDFARWAGLDRSYGPRSLAGEACSWLVAGRWQVAGWGGRAPCICICMAWSVVGAILQPFLTFFFSKIPFPILENLNLVQYDAVAACMHANGPCCSSGGESVPTVALQALASL